MGQPAILVERVRCPDCGRSFAPGNSLGNHLAAGHGPRPCACGCGILVQRQWAPGHTSRTPEVRAKIRARSGGGLPQTRAASRIAMRRLWADPAWRAQFLEKQRAAFARRLIRPEDHERQRWARHMERLYGLGVEDFARLLERQGWTCALCNRRLSLTWHGYAVDHDHGTKRVRGILCSPCNRGLMVQVEIIGLERLVTYLRG
jgi:recombination endonuclease VII